MRVKSLNHMSLVELRQQLMIEKRSHKPYDYKRQRKIERLIVAQEKSIRVWASRWSERSPAMQSGLVSLIVKGKINPKTFDERTNIYSEYMGEIILEVSELNKAIEKKENRKQIAKTKHQETLEFVNQEHLEELVHHGESKGI